MTPNNMPRTRGMTYSMPQALLDTAWKLYRAAVDRTITATLAAVEYDEYRQALEEERRWSRHLEALQNIARRAAVR